MYHRLICVILAALMPFLLAMPAFAQDETPAPVVICGDLSEEDCAILEESALAMRDLSSYAMNMSMDFSMSGIPELPADPLAFNVQLDGRFAFDEASKAVMLRMYDLQSSGTQENMQALIEDMPDLILDLYRGMNFDMTMSYSLPAELAEVLSQDSEVAIPDNFSLDTRMIGGMMYVNLAQIRDLIPDAEDTFTSDWIGIDYVGLLEMQMDSSSAMDENPFTAGAMGGLMTAQLIKDMQEFVTVERLDDVNLGDQQGAVFTYAADVAGFFASDAFLAMLSNMSTAMGEEAPSASEMEEAGTMIAFMAPMLFRDLEVGYTSTVGVDDYLAYSTTFDFSWDLASLMQFAAMTDPSLAESMGDAEPVITFNLAMDLSDFDAEMNFEAPEDVQIIPLDEMMPGDTSTVF